MCTYKREHVFLTLESLAAQQLPGDLAMEVIVVNNDKASDLRGRIMAFADSHRFTVKYGVEPEPNIALARNLTLSHAEGDWIAFIDDDEIAEPDWLALLHKAALTYQADAVMGTVRAHFPKETPAWIISAGFLDRSMEKTGTEIALTMARTGNALLKGDWVHEKGLRFQSSYGRTGGEDSRFFRLLLEKGGKMISCKEAVVSEKVEAKHLNERYYFSRAVRGGENHARDQLNDRNGFVKLVFFCKSIFKLVLFAGKSLMFLPMGKNHYMQPAAKVMGQLGKLRYQFGASPLTLYGED